MNCFNGLLDGFRRSINRGSTHSNLTSKLISLRRQRFLHLFLGRSLSLRSYLIWRSLLCCAIWIIVIDHRRFVWPRCLRLLLLLLLGDGRLILRRGPKEMDWLIYVIAYCSLYVNIVKIIEPFAGLPILQVAWQHDAPIRCLWLL